LPLGSLRSVCPYFHLLQYQNNHVNLIYSQGGSSPPWIYLLQEKNTQDVVVSSLLVGAFQTIILLSQFSGWLTFAVLLIRTHAGLLPPPSLCPTHRHCVLRVVIGVLRVVVGSYMSSLGPTNCGWGSCRLVGELQGRAMGYLRPHLLLAVVNFELSLDSPLLGLNLAAVRVDSPLSSTRLPSHRTLALGSLRPGMVRTAGVGRRWSSWRSLHPRRSSLFVVSLWWGRM